MQNKRWYNTSDPRIVGVTDIKNKEFGFWLYTPIKTPESGIVYPDNLLKWRDIVDVCVSDFGGVDNHYIYLTVKSLYITPDNLGQRDGWHSDGFLSEDTNYIWSDCNPTTFSYASVLLSECHTKSLEELSGCKELEEYSYNGYKNTIYKLTPDCIHKPATPSEGMFRNFVKVSISKNAYRHEGITTNHKLNFSVECKDTPLGVRNCPI